MAPLSETHLYTPKEREPLLRRKNVGNPMMQQKRKGNKRWSRGGPDGPLAWIVAFANFLINFIVVGLGRMSGLLYVVFMGMFHVDRETAALPFSVQQAARNLFGPMAGILGQKYGVRIVTVGGGFIGFLSAVVCYFATDIKCITVMWGLAFGICTALTTTLNQVTIDQYFERHQTTAGGLAFSGGCVGAFIFPGILEWLISTYGMPITFLVMGVVILVVVPAALILKDPPWMKKDADQIMIKSGTEEKKDLYDYRTFSKPTWRLSEVEEIQKNFQPLEKVNFDYLRGKSEIVNQLFILTLFHNSDSILNTEWPTFSNESFIKELEHLYHFLRYNPTSATSMSSESSSQVGTVLNELTHNVHLIQDIHLYRNDGSLMHSFQPIDSEIYEGNDRYIFLASKVCDLCDKDTDDVLSYFAPEDHKNVSRVLEIMEKLEEMVKNYEHCYHSSTLRTNLLNVPNENVNEQSSTLKASGFKTPISSNGYRLKANSSESSQSDNLSASVQPKDLGTSTVKTEAASDETKGTLENRVPSASNATPDIEAPNGQSKVTFHMDATLNNLNTATNRTDMDHSSPENESQITLPDNFSTPSNSRSSKRRENSSNVKHSNSFLDHICTAIYLHKNLLFLLICICRGVFMLTFIPMVTIVVDFATDQGLDRSSGKYIIAILSLGDLLGRLCLGWINDIGFLSLPRYMLIAMLLLGCNTALLPLMRSELSLIPGVLVFGLLQGSLFIRHQVLVSQYMSGHEQTIGMGFINMLSGFLGFALPSYIGYFRDTQGSYDGMLYVNGAICACVGLLWIFEPCFMKGTEKSSEFGTFP